MHFFPADAASRLLSESFETREGEAPGAGANRLRDILAEMLESRGPLRPTAPIEFEWSERNAGPLIRVYDPSVHTGEMIQLICPNGICPPGLPRSGMSNLPPGARGSNLPPGMGLPPGSPPGGGLSGVAGADRPSNLPPMNQTSVAPPTPGYPAWQPIPPTPPAPVPAPPAPDPEPEPEPSPCEYEATFPKTHDDGETFEYTGGAGQLGEEVAFSWTSAVFHAPSGTLTFSNGTEVGFTDNLDGTWTLTGEHYITADCCPETTRLTGEAEGVGGDESLTVRLGVTCVSGA